MLTEERIAEIFQESLDTRKQQWGYNNSDVLKAIKNALVENEAVVASTRAVDNLQKVEHEVAGIETGTLSTRQRLYAPPPCTLPFKEGEYAPEFDVALGEWVYPKYKRCPGCVERCSSKKYGIIVCICQSSMKVKLSQNSSSIPDGEYEFVFNVKERKKNPPLRYDCEDQNSV